MRLQKSLPGIFLSIFLCCIGYAIADAQQYQPDWESLDHRQVPEWYQQAKFGIFIHWGVYSVPAYSPVGSYSEWYQHSLRSDPNGAVARYHKAKFGTMTYYQLAGRFKAELFNPDAWAALFQKSGAKYVVLTSKHHDGFCLWPSKEADRDWGFPWNAAEVGPKQDLIGELFTALRKTDVRPGLYYSLYEWYNPLYLKDPGKFVATHTIPQMKDLIARYKPYVLWTDGGWEQSDTTWQATKFLSWLYNDSPVKDSIVTYDRWGSGVRFHHGLVYTPEYQPGLTFNDHYFEESQGMGYSYGYNRAEDAWDYSSSRLLILQLIDIVSRGGNFLLDIGPTADGKIPPIMQERLLAIGKWLSVNGAAIYGTRPWRSAFQWSQGDRTYKKKKGDVALLLKQTVDPSPGYAVKEIFFTFKQNKLYCILPKYPEGNQVVINDLELPRDAKVTFLATGQELKWAGEGGNILVHMPPFDPGRIGSSEAYVLEISGVPDFAKRPEIRVRYKTFTADPEVMLTAPGEGTTIYYTSDGTSPSATSTLYTHPFTLKANTTIKAMATAGGRLHSSPASRMVIKHDWMNSQKVAHARPGIRYKYYETERPGLEAMDHLTATREGVVPVISLKKKMRKDKFCFSFEGLIRINKTGIYHFYTASDDGSDLWIDGQRVVDNNGAHNNEDQDARVALKKGFHRIKVRYYDSGGDNSLDVGFQPEGGTKTPLPASLLFYQP